MASFIGSNLQSLHYNFKHKIAGSTVENPLKIYSASVNPSNLPAPTSTEWKEIKNQNFIDRLGQQNGNTVVETTSNSVLGNIVSTNAPVDGMMNIEIGGNTLKNEIVNGDFSNGTTGWNYSNSSILVNNCEATFTATRVYEGLRQGTSKVGHKYYFTANIRTNSQNVKLFVRKGEVIGIVGDNIYRRVSILSSPSVEQEFSAFSIEDWSSVDFLPVSVREVMVIDLTAMFGAGNEPTKEWCDANLSYFDGVKSVGEAEGSKLEALSCGKNLLKEKITESAGVTISNLNDEFKLEWTGGFNATIESVTGTLCKVKKNTSYTISFYSRKLSALAKIRIRGENGEYITGIVQLDNISDIKNISSFNTGNNEKIKVDIIRNGSEIGSTILKQFQLEEGTTATSYEPYKEDKINILLSKPLTTGSKISGDTVTYADGTTEKLPQPLTLQSFKGGTLQVNTAIPPYIKEWHTTNADDQGVMQYQSGTTGLSQAFLIEIDLTQLCNDLFGGSNSALKSALKQIFINCYGSNPSGWRMYMRRQDTNAWSQWNDSTKDSIYNNTTLPYPISPQNKIYMLLVSNIVALDNSPSILNLDYFNANIDIARQPDNVIIPDTVKNTYIPTNYTIFAKVACLKTDNKKVITQYYKDTNNYIELNIENNKINFVKCINGVITTLSSNVLDYNKYQVVGIVAQQQNTGMKLSVLKNNGECEHFSNTDINLLNVATEWKLGQDINITNQLDGFILDYQFTDKTFTNTECEVMLKGRNTTGDITYDSFVRDYQNGKIQSGFILPNNRYKITGQAKLYYNNNYSRTVENCEFVAKDDENKVELVGMAELVRVD